MSTALITGVVGGIGYAIAKRLQRDGHDVVISDLPSEQFDKRINEATGMGAYAADLSDSQAVASLFTHISNTHTPPQIVVNAAGGVCGQTGQPVECVSDSQWSAIFAANVDSAFQLAKAALPGMQKAGCGRFITISSGAGLKPSLTGIQAYTAAKHALVGLTRQLAMDVGPFGITVNSVSPGFVLSNESSRKQWESYGDAGQAELMQRIYTRRLGQPEDIANAVAFLASAEASWITGQILQVDGGTS